MPRTQSAALIGIASVLLGLQGGCAAWATYPPIDETADWSGPARQPVPTLMADAIRVTRERKGGPTDFAINLPPGTPPAVYDQVIKRLGAGHPMKDLDEPAYHVTKVMSRGFNAKVDLFYPTPKGDYTFATISLERGPHGSYRHVYTRRWQTGDQPPPPAYRSAPRVASGEQES